MQLSATIRKLATAATIGLLAGIGAPLAAPSPVASDRDEAAIVAAPDEDALLEEYLADDDYYPGMHGVDYALITGPRAPTSPNAVPACANEARKGDLRDCSK